MSSTNVFPLPPLGSNHLGDSSRPARAPHPNGDRTRRLNAFAQAIRKSLPETSVTFSTATRCTSDTLGVPPYITVELSPDTLAHLCSMWQCLAFAQGNEMHQWNIASFGFLRELEPGNQEAPLISIQIDGQDIATTGTMPKVDFDGLHACVFADGEVSFYLVGPDDIIVNSASMFDLRRIWDLNET
jgi:hypothetical protein